MACETDNVIDISGLHFAYGHSDILHDVSLHVGKGEMVGLLGPNGSGKSTILKILSGILPDKYNNVNVTGQALHTLSRKSLAQRMATIPQEPVFSFPFTVLEVVLMGRQPHHAGLALETKEDIAIAEAALARCGATDLAGRIIHELSSGERQRVVFARALAQQPEILLLDEPASFLDIRHQVELYDIVRDLACNQHCSILTVMHDINLAVEYCDRIYLLCNGKIAAGGTVDEVINTENISRVFNTPVMVDTNTVTGKPLVLPLSKQATAAGR